MKQYKIYHGDNEFDASQYQCEIFDNIENGSGNMVINASAGSSKTTTIVNSLRYVKPEKKVLFIAFNKDIVETIKSQVNRDNTNICTFHSLGRSVLIENKVIDSDSEPDDFKYKNRIKEYVASNITDSSKVTKKQYNLYIKNIIDLVNYSRYYMNFTVREIKKTAEQYGVTPIYDEFNVCREILLWGKEHTELYDYTDMIWLCNVLNLPTKKYRYDWIFVDEIQDASIMQQELILKCFKRGCRFVGVGDDEQKINVWCGSSTDSIDNFKTMKNTKVFELPMSYRCPKKIVKFAQQFSKRIIENEKAIEGEINGDVNAYAPNTGDMVLCRNTAPLIELHLKYLQGNKKSYIRGAKDIKDRYLTLLKNSHSKFIDKNCITSTGLFPVLYTQLFDRMHNLSNKFNLSEEEVMIHPSIIQLYDDINGIKIISEGLTEVEDLINKTSAILGGDDDNAIQLSTIHKVKGLEADNVFIYYPSLLPSKWAKKDWEKETERNLCYVAYTRAKKTLNFIHEDKFSLRNSGRFMLNEMKSELELIKRKIEYSKEIGITDSSFIKKEHTTIKLGDTVPTGSTTTKKSRVKGAQKLRNLLD